MYSTILISVLWLSSLFSFLARVGDGIERSFGIFTYEIGVRSNAKIHSIVNILRNWDVYNSHYQLHVVMDIDLNHFHK